MLVSGGKSFFVSSLMTFKIIKQTGVVFVRTAYPKALQNSNDFRTDSWSPVGG